MTDVQSYHALTAQTVEKMNGSDILDALGVLGRDLVRRLSDFDADCEKRGAKCTDPAFTQSVAALRGAIAGFGALALQGAEARSKAKAPMLGVKLFADVARSEMAKALKESGAP